MGVPQPDRRRIPQEIQLGVAAVNTLTEPFKAEFSELEVYKKETR